MRDRANQRMSSKAVGFHRVAGALAQGVGGEQDIPLGSSQPVNAHVNLKNTQHISQLEYRAKLLVLCGTRLGLNLWHLDQIVRRMLRKTYHFENFLSP
ncbi:hypothetical protein [Salipiger mangrovisoli]|uniref:hypothetical protein n=1 Tax=Salipiger mangrovisoli TaxID=2865933 RepID=UPI00187F482D|nr:hypothetical protein [Salipiger mangrovisoli]